jgi:hypothetical protein
MLKNVVHHILLYSKLLTILGYFSGWTLICITVRNVFCWCLRFLSYFFYTKTIFKKNKVFWQVGSFGGKKVCTAVWLGNLKIREHLKYPVIDGHIMVLWEGEDVNLMKLASAEDRTQWHACINMVVVGFWQYHSHLQTFFKEGHMPNN